MYSTKMSMFAMALLIVAPLAVAGGDHAHEHDDHGASAKSEQHDGHGHGADGHAEHHHGGWTAPAEMAARDNPVAATKASVERGRKIFTARCATCHGNRGRGGGPAAAPLDPKPADLVVMAPQHTDGDFAWRIATGRGAMPAWENVLSEEQIWDVVNYLKALPSLAASQSASGSGQGHGHGHGGHDHASKHH